MDIDLVCGFASMINLKKQRWIGLVIKIVNVYQWS